MPSKNHLNLRLNQNTHAHAKLYPFKMEFIIKSTRVGTQLRNQNQMLNVRCKSYYKLIMAYQTDSHP